MSTTQTHTTIMDTLFARTIDSPNTLIVSVQEAHAVKRELKYLSGVNVPTNGYKIEPGAYFGTLWGIKVIVGPISAEQSMLYSLGVDKWWEAD